MIRDKSIVRRDVSAESMRDMQSLHPMLARVFAARGVHDPNELEKPLKALIPFKQMHGIIAATQCLSLAVQQQKRIIIVGDFDADGATSSAIAVSSLYMMGAKHVHFLVPNRFEYGYGLTPEIVKVANEWQPDVLITVDNGIASNEGVAAAKALGIKVVVTDHHLPGDTLPDADAIVNPNQPDCQFPSKNLAGCGVIFYVMLALRAELRAQNWFEQQGLADPNMGTLLDLVALGTIADLVPLDRNNRILVHQGLKRMRAGHCRYGIKALIDIGKRDLAHLVGADMAFAVAPRLNAAGRLDDMSIGIACLLADNETQARKLAQQLDELNKERRMIETDMQLQAMVEVRKLKLDEADAPVGLALFDPSWHQGVIGIVAGRIKERLHRPVIAFAKVDGGELKGSARSIPGLHIRDALDLVSKRKPGLMNKFGGHAMAAGLSLPEANYGAFKQCFDDVVRELVDEADLEAIVHSDGELAGKDLTINMAELIKQAGPWGQAFPEPIFDGEFEIVDQRLLQGKYLKLTLAVPDTTRTVDAIAFSIDVEKWPNHRCRRVHLAYRLDINRFGGHHHLQLMVEHIIALSEN